MDKKHTLEVNRGAQCIVSTLIDRAVGSGEAGEALASPVFNPYYYISMLTFL